MKTLKEINKELMRELRKIYPSGRLVYYSEEHNHIIVKPFKKSEMEFGIFLEGVPIDKNGNKEVYIIRSDMFNEPYDHSSAGDVDSKVYMIKDCGSLEKGFNFQVILECLKKAIKKYVKEEQDFYNDGLEIEREFTRDEKEAKELAGIIYENGYLKELGIRR